MPHSESVSRTVLDFAQEPGCAAGLRLSSLAAGTIVSVTTRHSEYRVLVIDPREGRALITSKTWFPEPTEVRLEGATAGGSMMKTGWIGIGLKLEISVGGQRVITSPVASVTVLSVPS